MDHAQPGTLLPCYSCAEVRHKAFGSAMTLFCTLMLLACISARAPVWEGAVTFFST